MQRTFTFTANQVNPVTGKRLRNYYVVIEGESAEHCRVKMLNHFGPNWAFEYSSPESAGSSGYRLTELPKDEWPASTDAWYMNESGTCTYRG